MPRRRCRWAETHPLMIPYHDEEWGRPVHDDRLLFEMLNLEGAQAGLSWLTILKKRAAYRAAFDEFDAKKIVKYDAARKRALLKNEGIVRHAGKIDAVIGNARAFLEVRHEHGSFDAFVWSFADAGAAAMSRALKQHGFRFVGPTICYAFMQAVGMVDDHEKGCFRAKKRRSSRSLRS